jgi:hypothetical protein
MCLIVASVTMLLITLLDDNEANPPIIVAYLRKRNVVLSHCYNSANVIEPREPHTCNNIYWISINQRGRSEMPPQDLCMMYHYLFPMALQRGFLITRNYTHGKPPLDE